MRNHLTIEEFLAAARENLGKLAIYYRPDRQTRIGSIRVASSGSTGSIAFDWTKRRGVRTLNALVTFPALPVNAKLTRREAEVWLGYAVHEIGGHAFHTDNVAWDQAVKVGRGFARLVNGLEDPRVEALAVKVIPGARARLEDVLNHVLDRALAGGYDPMDPLNLPFTFALLGRVRLFGLLSAKIKKEIAAKLTPQARRWFRRHLDTLAACRSTEDVVALAHVIAKEVKLPEGVRGDDNPPPPPPQNDDQQEQQDGEQQDGEQQDGEQQDGEQQDGEQQDGEQQDGEQQDGEQQDGEQQDGDEGDEGQGETGEGGDETDEDGDEDDAGQGDETDEDGDEGDETGGTPGDDQGQDGDQKPVEQGDDTPGDADATDAPDAPQDPQDAPGQGGDEGGTGDGDGSPWEISKDDMAKLRDPEPDISDTVEKILDRAAKSGDSGYVYGGVTIQRKAANGDYRHVSNGATDELRAAARLGSARNRGLLKQILVSAERSGWNSYERAGTLNPADIARSQTGDENVFRRRWTEEGISTTVSILVDGSGSMSGERMAYATAMAYVLADVVEKCGLQSEVAVFRDGHGARTSLPVFDNGWRAFKDRWGGMTQRAQSWGIQSEHDMGQNDGDSCDLFLVQERGERLNRPEVMDRFTRMFNVADNGTPDFAGTMGMVLRLARTAGDRKILFVVTDGQGANPAAQKWAVDWAKRVHDIDVIGIGIGAHTAVYLREQYRLWTVAAMGAQVGTGPGAGRYWSAFAAQALTLLVKQARTNFKARRSA
jgi:hypothetical protein